METQKRYVGIDLSKQSMTVAILQNSKLIQKKLSTSSEGKEILMQSLSSKDVVGLETGNHAFIMARLLLQKVGCTVYVLNAGKLHIIFRSHKKTDKEDAIRLAKFIQRTPEEELPIVSLPSEETLCNRKLMAENNRLVKDHQRSVTTLHNLFWDAGITELQKKELQNPQTRKAQISRLPVHLQRHANRLIQQLELYETQLGEVESEQTEVLKAHVEEVTISMSVPGVGLKVALGLLSYIGDMSRFSNVGQLCYFAGLTPKLDQSGTINHTKGISKCGPKHLRKLLNQAAWASIRSRGGDIFKMYVEHLRRTKGKKKAIVAVGRKLLSILYALHKKRELFEMPNHNNHELVLEKLTKYKIIEKESKKRRKNKKGLDE